MRSKCPECGSSEVWKNGHSRHGKQLYRCKKCGKVFVENPKVGWRKRITEETIEHIRNLNLAGFNDYEIADILGISYVTVSKYRKKMGLQPVGPTCCSMYNIVKDPELRKKIETCGKITLEFLDDYFGKRRHE